MSTLRYKTYKINAPALLCLYYSSIIFLLMKCFTRYVSGKSFSLTSSLYSPKQTRLRSELKVKDFHYLVGRGQSKTCATGRTLLSAAEDDMSWDPKMAPKLDFEECFYLVLEVDPLADAKELKKAYYKLVFRYHPDNKESSEEKALCNKQMMVINGAYAVLKDPITRTSYDKQRSKGLFGLRAKVKPSSSSPTVSQSKSSESGSPTVERMKQRRNREQSDTSEGFGFGGAWRRSSSSSDDAAWTENFNGGESGFDYDFFEEEWFDKELKEKLRVSREREKAENAVNIRGRQRGKTIFEEIAELLKEEERGRSSRQKQRDFRQDTFTNYEHDFRQQSSSYFRSDDSEELRHLQDSIQRLERELLAKETAIRLDPTDWGEVTDARAVEERLDKITEVKELQRRLEQMKELLAGIRQGSKSINGEWYTYDYEDERERGTYRDRKKQPQPQPNRSIKESRRDLWSDGNEDFSEWTGFQPDESPEEMSWRRAYDRRRRDTGNDQANHNIKKGDDFILDEMKRLRKLK